jgi:hypothetical protein
MEEEKKVFCPECGRELRCQKCDLDKLKSDVENLKVGDVIRGLQVAFGEKKKYSKVRKYRKVQK